MYNEPFLLSFLIIIKYLNVSCIINYFYIKEKRPSVDEIEEFLMRNEDWIIPNLFDGADPRMVAHSIASKHMYIYVKLFLLFKISYFKIHYRGS